MEHGNLNPMQGKTQPASTAVLTISRRNSAPSDERQAELQPVIHANLLENARQMVLDRLFRDAKPRGNVSIRSSIRDRRRDLLLTRRQRDRRLTRRDHPGARLLRFQLHTASHDFRHTI
jgi:hypothetical protein